MTQIIGTTKAQFFNDDGTFCVGGKVYSYDAGTLNARATYPTVTDANNSTNANDNPIILDARGEANLVIRGATKLILKDSHDVEIWSVDNIDSTSINIYDSNGNELLTFNQVSSAANQFSISNATSSNAPIFAAEGGDTNINIKLVPKGSGVTNLTGAGADIDGTLNVDGSSTLHGDVTASSNFHILGNATVDGTLTVNVGSIAPVGCVLPFAGASTPSGWLSCDGSAVNRTTYATLFSVLGTTWGSGDGTTTFNLPDLRRKALVGVGGSGTATLANTVGSTGGEETHALSSGEMPSHTHNYDQGISGANFTAGGTIPLITNLTGGTKATTSTGSGTAHNIMQPSAVVIFIVKAV